MPPASSAEKAPESPEARFARAGLLQHQKTGHDLNAAIFRRPDKQDDAYALPLDKDFKPTPSVGLPWSIKKILHDQKRLEHAPWHAPGGDWSFIHAEIQGAGFLFGFSVEPAGMPGMESYESGEGLLIATDPTSAEKLLGAFGAYLGAAPLPAPKADAKPRPLRMRVGLFAGELTRDSITGSFERRDPQGGWVCTKLTIEVEGFEGAAEIYLNFDPSQGVGEFSEKEPEYRPDVMAVLRYSLRSEEPPRD